MKKEHKDFLTGAGWEIEDRGDYLTAKKDGHEVDFKSDAEMTLWKTYLCIDSKDSISHVYFWLDGKITGVII